MKKVTAKIRKMMKKNKFHRRKNTVKPCEKLNFFYHSFFVQNNIDSFGFGNSENETLETRHLISAKLLFSLLRISVWYSCVMYITIVQLQPANSELRFNLSLNSTCEVSQIYDDENI